MLPIFNTVFFFPTYLLDLFMFPGAIRRTLASRTIAFTSLTRGCSKDQR